MAGFGGEDGKAGKSTKKPQLNFQKWFNQAIYSHKTGRLREAEAIYKKMITVETSDPAVFCNLGILCKNSGRINEALNTMNKPWNSSLETPRFTATSEIYTGISESLI